MGLSKATARLNGFNEDPGMTYGITGNTSKEQLWEPVAELVEWLSARGASYALAGPVSDGLARRGLLPRELSARHAVLDLATTADIILSFGGDGTLLNTAHFVGRHATPILGINIGRLGFLADTEVEQMRAAIDEIERGKYRVEERMVLHVQVESGHVHEERWSLNEVVLQRSGISGLIAIDVDVDGTRLNSYWADGLICATPTGSTAYSLAAGGPILAPGCSSMVLTPLAPHTLTVRPVVLPDTSTIRIRVRNPELAHVVSTDGRSIVFERSETLVTVTRAGHSVRLVRLLDQHFFQTIRTKLMWGLRKES
jgi:NAD+ kinase